MGKKEVRTCLPVYPPVGGPVGLVHHVRRGFARMVVLT